MQTTSEFCTRVLERYAADGGLSAVFAPGGTRTTYILAKNRYASDPGKIGNFDEHSEYLQNLYQDLIKAYFDLGGQYLVITGFSFRGFSNRGAEYSRIITAEMFKLTNDGFAQFYRENNLIPSFVGIDTLLGDPELRDLGEALDTFQKNWPVKQGQRRVVWEIASMPLFSLWNIYRGMSAEDHAKLQSDLDAQSNLDDQHRFLYNFFARRIYGFDIPMPHFYLGTNRSGDLKWRSPMPIGLTGGDGTRSAIRMFYTPYPTLMTRPETLQAIVEDVAFGKRFYAPKTDYSGQYTPELAAKEYERFMQLTADPGTTLGLSRDVEED